MNINLFEGGRRAAKVIGCILTAVFVGVTLKDWERLGVTPLFGLAAALFLLWVFTKAVGWIVRGFFGIPKGMDYRIEKTMGYHIKIVDLNDYTK